MTAQSITGTTVITNRILRLAMVAICCISVCCTQGSASSNVAPSDASTTHFVHATGPSEIGRPAGVKKSDVDAVAVEQNGRNVPVDFQATDAGLIITPCTDLEGGVSCTIKVFTRMGKRYPISARVEEFPSLTPDRRGVIKMPAKPSKGFNYAYFLCVPESIDRSASQRLLVQGNNDPSATGANPAYAESSARNYISHGWGRRIADGLRVPYLMPVFPRQYFNRQPDYAYLQFLDRGTLTIKGKEERADLQLIAMITDARQFLALNGIKMEEKVFMIGFSSDGKFSQRFTVLHPDLVAAAFAGGIAGITTFPLSEYKGEKLCYPIGVADLKELTGKEFDKAEYSKVPQLFCMGENETTDAVEYPDCYPKEDAEQIRRLFGRKVMPDRWAAARQVLADSAPNVQCKTFPGIGHDVNNEVTNDVVKFFQDHGSR